MATSSGNVRRSGNKSVKSARLFNKLFSEVNLLDASSGRSCESLKKQDMFAVKTVEEVVDKIFDDFGGTAETTSSSCSVERKHSEYSFDRRLQYWKNYLENRKQTAERICQETGKLPKDVLFNRATTIDEPDKQTVKTVIDYADRMNATQLSNREPSKLKGYVDPCTCARIAELQETLPRAERIQFKNVEIIGMPNITKEEQLGCDFTPVTGKTRWLNSEVLGQRIGAKQEDIERVVEFVPDMDKLQVVGQNYQKLHTIVHDPEIDILPEEKIQQISSDTLCEPDDIAEEIDPSLAVPPEYGLKINERVYKITSNRSLETVQVDERFECEPYTFVVKKVLNVENLGQSVLNFEWFERAYYNKNPQLLKAIDNELVFDHSPFRLTMGEMRSVIVRFQPRRVNHVKARWCLKVDPPVFCCSKDPVVLTLEGKCTPSPEYVDKLDDMLRSVVAKSNLKSMRIMNTNLASLTPLITPFEELCPYQRALTEWELFEIENPGIKCSRLQDLELLKDIYKRVKKPREPDWDLNLDTLKAMILNNKGPEDRALLFSEMTYIVEQMRGEAVALEQKLDDVDGHEYTRLLLVHGVIATGVEDWEALTVKVEQAFLVPTVDRFVEEALRVQEQDEEEQSEEPAKDSPPLEEEAVKKTVLPQVRRNKALRDTLFVQTYSHLCRVIESIVSVIEGTDDV